MSQVSVQQDKKANYPEFPYFRDGNHPELKKSPSQLDTTNKVFAMVRQILADLGLDNKNFGTPKWNPLSHIIKPGQRVLLKPNWVIHENQRYPSENLDELVTHSSIIRAVIEYVALGLEGKGTVTIADAPIQSCDFSKLMERTKFAELLPILKKDYPNIKFELLDLRKTQLSTTGQASVPGDPYGYSLVDLGDDSLLTDLDKQAERLRVTNYDHRKLYAHHQKGIHQYLISRAVLDADLIINLPKMKCHLKAGLTGALKNIVGINGNKEFLPHHISGSSTEGGDQYIHTSSLKTLFNRLYDQYWSSVSSQFSFLDRLRGFGLNIFAKFSQLFSRDYLLDGGWFGNETVPRMTIDLNNVLYHFDSKSAKFLQKPRIVLNIIDGIVAGENEGPLKPKSKYAGIIIGGFSPVLCDATMAYLLGYDPNKLKTIAYALNHKKSRLNPDHIKLRDVTINFNGHESALSKLPNLHFIKPKYWRKKADR